MESESSFCELLWSFAILLEAAEGGSESSQYVIKVLEIKILSPLSSDKCPCVRNGLSDTLRAVSVGRILAYLQGKTTVLLKVWCLKFSTLKTETFICSSALK